MTTVANFQTAIDLHTQAMLINAPTNYRVVFPGTSDQAMANDTQFRAYIRQEIILSRQKQLYLGNENPNRNWGYLLNMIHVKKNTGYGVRNAMLDKILKSFRSKRVGGVTFLDATVPMHSEVGSWSVTGISISFYFDDEATS